MRLPQGVLERGGFACCISKDAKMDFVVAYRYSHHERCVLVIAKDPFPMPLFDVLREIRGKVFMRIEERVCVGEILGNTDNFGLVILSGMYLNRFEVMFLHKHLSTGTKRLLHLVRGEVDLPVGRVRIERIRYTEVFCDRPHVWGLGQGEGSFTCQAGPQKLCRREPQKGEEEADDREDAGKS